MEERDKRVPRAQFLVPSEGNDGEPCNVDGVGQWRRLVVVVFYIIKLVASDATQTVIMIKSDHPLRNLGNHFR